MFLSADIPIGLDSIPVMIEQAKKSPESVVKVSRWLKRDSFYGYNRTKKTFNALAQSFLRILFNARLTDFTIPVLISPTKTYKNIIFKEWRFSCFLEMVLVPVRIKKDFIEVPAKCFSRTEGKSKNSALQTAMYLKTAFRIRFSPKGKIYRCDD